MTLLVGIAMGFVASLLVHAGLVLLSLSRAKRFGPLMVAEHNEHVVIMFDPEAERANLPRRAARAAFGATNTTMWGFPPEVARQMAKKIREIADGIEVRHTAPPSKSEKGPN
jgi:hypothetical protein